MMRYLSELYAMVRVRWQIHRLALNLYSGNCNGVNSAESDLCFCYDVLQDVSRSFALVIMQLCSELRDAVCVFYLILRALDTIEDDMNLSVEFKLAELPQFHMHLQDPEWNMCNAGTGRERDLLIQFPHVSAAFSRLGKPYQDVISDICERMANGLVGHGLTRLYVLSGLEDPQLGKDLALANHMGLMLQKTNIVRDFHEDMNESPPRVFWPQEIWGKYTSDLDAFKNIECDARDDNSDDGRGSKEQALGCLNAMVADALVHLPPVVEYLASLHNPSTFAFSAIPQVMAIATLAIVLNNADVFRRKVKLTRGTTCLIIHQSTELLSALALMKTQAQLLLNRADPNDASHEKISLLVGRAVASIDKVLAEKHQVSDGLARRMITRYPALGGRLLYTLTDSIAGYFAK